MLNKEIRLDYLQNPKLDLELINMLCGEYNFNSIASNEEITHIESFREKLRIKFNKKHVMPFSFNTGGFLELFMHFDTIYFLPSIHYEVRKALELVSESKIIIKIPIDDIYGNLEDKFKNHKNKPNKTLVIAPLLNEDIFSINDFNNIRDIIGDTTFALDISYALALGLDIKYDANIYLINSASLALLNGVGLIASDKAYVSDIYRNNISKAIYFAIQKRSNSRFDFVSKDNDLLYSKLKEILGDDLMLFASNYPSNTLPLRFKFINTRNLIQHLYLDNIFIQSSQDCSLGVIQPSHTLLSLGFGMLKARELCTITFKELEEIDFLVDKISSSYKMIRLMEF